MCRFKVDSAADCPDIGESTTDLCLALPPNEECDRVFGNSAFTEVTKRSYQATNFFNDIKIW